MKRDSFNVLFFIKKAKLLKNGEASVCMRITVNGARVENNIRKSIEPALWKQAKECAKGKSRKSCDLNAYIEDARIKLHQTFNELEEQRQFITARLLQEKFFGQDQVPEVVRTLIQTIQEHNEQFRELVGKDYALITVRRYESCKRYLAELIKQKYGKEDLPLSEVNGELVRAFEFYLKTEKECQQNTVIRYMKCLKKITNLALANEWISKDPFIGIKFQEKEIIREFLTMDELLTIYHKEYPLERITIVRYVFIFAAFTGLAFIDVQQLAPAVVQITWTRRDKNEDVVDYEHFSIPFILTVDDALVKIDNLTMREMPGGTLFPDTMKQYDDYTIREAFHNCIAHQDYTLQQRINFVENPGYIYYANGGSFIPSSLQAALKTQGPQRHFRNQRLCNAMVNFTIKRKNNSCAH